MARRLPKEVYGEPWTTERLARRIGLTEKSSRQDFDRRSGRPSTRTCGTSGSPPPWPCWGAAGA